MYVCICNSIKENDIRAQARGGSHDTPEGLIESLSGCLQCGLCADEVECIMEEEGCLGCEKQQECGTPANNNTPQSEEFVKLAAE